MFPVSRRLTLRDFLLMGASVATLVILVWPTGSDRQGLLVHSPDGQVQHYSLSVDDPSLLAIKERIKKWSKPTTSRQLRSARWHHQLANFYLQRDAATDARDSVGDQSMHGERGAAGPAGSVTQVSFENPGLENRAIGNRGERGPTHEPVAPSATANSFWAELSKSSSLRIADEQRRLRIAAKNQRPPVALGAMVESVRSPLAYPTAMLVALGTVGIAVFRQRARPPIELACSVENSPGGTGPQTICLRIPADWVRVQQPIEVLLWRMGYAMAVGAAAAGLVVASLP